MTKIPDGDLGDTPVQSVARYGKSIGTLSGLYQAVSGCIIAQLVGSYIGVSRTNFCAER